MSGIYIVRSSVWILTQLLPFINWIPAHGSDSKSYLGLDTIANDAFYGRCQPDTTIPKFVPWLCLAAMVVTYINIGAYWTYIDLAAALRWG